MPGARWTREQKEIYRSRFSVGRIVDEIWILIAIAFFIISVFVEDRLTRDASEVFFFGGFLALGGLAYWLLPRVLEKVMPAELWESLPRGRFDPPPTNNTPKTYGELFGRWFRPNRW